MDDFKGFKQFEFPFSNLVFICFVCFRFHSWTEINEEGKKGFEPDSAEIRKSEFLGN